VAVVRNVKLPGIQDDSAVPAPLYFAAYKTDAENAFLSNVFAFKPIISKGVKITILCFTPNDRTETTKGETMKGIHPLLKQQLKQHFTSSDDFSVDCKAFLKSVNTSYYKFEKDVQQWKGTLKLSASELSQTTAEMEAIFKVLPDIVFRVDCEDRIRYVNGGDNHNCKLHPEELQDLHIKDIPIPELAEKLSTAVPMVREQESKSVIEFSTAVHEEQFHFECRLLPSFDESVIVVIRDVTEHKMAELQIQQANAETEQLLASISSILIGVSADDRITRWNKAAEQTFGLEAEAVIGKMFMECGIQWNWLEILENISECRDKDTPTRLEDIRFTRADEREGILAITISPVVDEHNNHAGYLLLGSEITEHKFLEDQLAQAQKLESIGQLAAGIAHEINTPTQYVGDNTHFLSNAFGKITQTMTKYQELLAASKNGGISEEMIAEIEQTTTENKIDFLMEEIPSALEETLDGISKITSIVKAMKEYSHPGTKEKILSDINKALENTITVSRNEWKYDADVETNFDPELPKVPCLPGELNQVFLNIIVNAAHAIRDANKALNREKGLITVSTEPDGDDIIIRISDNGLGIPEQHQKKIFDPFFTTKEVGKGTGQGLAISYNVIVEKHQGSITFETENNKGTSFIIRLPIQNIEGQEQ